MTPLTDLSQTFFAAGIILGAYIVAVISYRRNHSEVNVAPAKKCPKCGMRMPSTAKKCPECGRKMS